MEEYTIITPTGDRPEAIRLCARYVQRQTILPKEWIVVDDGENSIEPDLPSLPYLKYLRRNRLPDDPKHTLPVQILFSLSHITTENVLFMEDDDWYSPSYAEVTLEKMTAGKGNLLVGQGRTIYYHLCGKYFVNPNKHHASLCQTGFKTKIIGSVERACLICRHKPFVDIELWKANVSKLVFFDAPLCVGIKGMPGRNGSTKGWDKSYPLYVEDPEFQFLEKTIGTDALIYREMTK